MMDSERRAASDRDGTAESSRRNKEMEKKKRSRVKQLLGDVKKQVEFWFGDVNVHKDRFLRKLIDDSDDGYVDISVLANFNRMKKLTVDTKLIARALKNSTVVEVNLEGNKVRRQYPIGDAPTDTDSRTVYVELLPKDVTHGWIERVFSKCGNVVYVSVPRYKSSGDSKGFAFVEFEKKEEASNAIEVLNNPPEDAPRKPGIFPKTKSGKAVPLPSDNPPTGGEEEKKKRKKKKKKDEKKDAAAAQVPSAGKERGKETVMELEPVEPKRKRSASEADGQKLPGKVSEKKRRRSHTAESAESHVPSKIRKTSESDGKESKVAETSRGGGVDDSKENRDDAAVKAKRKRKKKHKEKLKIGEEVIPLRVLPKNAWLALKDEYLQLQKCSMMSLKRCMNRMEQKEQMETDNCPEDRGKPASDKSEKLSNQGPQFTTGVIMKMTDSKPLPGRKFIKDALGKLSPVAYVDILEGDAEGYVRFHSPEEARVVSDARAELQKEHSWKLEILTGDHEQRYWQKILVDRQVKLNRPREKKRGTEKLISKAEKIIMARAKEAHKHIRFLDD